jgi:hypothetical protein
MEGGLCAGVHGDHNTPFLHSLRRFTRRGPLGPFDREFGNSMVHSGCERRVRVEVSGQARVTGESVAYGRTEGAHEARFAVRVRGAAAYRGVTRSCESGTS